MMERNEEKQQQSQYPIGRGYGHDYMRGGEVFGGYGYSAREDYERRRGDGLSAAAASPSDSEEPSDAAGEGSSGQSDPRDPSSFS